ncbi:MAG: hypothetical protein HY695_17890 [Deltaproteobacteria bacterium]|nr:hypothetical protein [Deltaproteobacteria bacterium]
MRKKFIGFILAATFCAITDANPPTLSAAATTIAPSSEALVLRNVVIRDGEVTGELMNNSKHTLREAQVLIRYTWHWKDERHPKDNPPGDAIFYTVPGEIPPGGTLRFTYKPSAPLRATPDGSFETRVSVAGFTEVIPVR